MLIRHQILLLVPLINLVLCHLLMMLFFTCGVEVARSLKALQKEKRAKLKANQHKSVDTINEQIAFFKSMCVPNAEKSKHDDMW